MKRVLMVFIFISSAFKITAQDSTYVTTNFLSLGYQVGYILQSNKFLKGANKTGEPIEYYHDLKLEFGWQTDGTAVWHKLYNEPRYGLGLEVRDFWNENEIGYPTIFYGFYDWPVQRWGSTSMHVGLGLGIAWDWKKFDKETNPYNNAIGDFTTLYIDIEFGFMFNLGRHWDLITSITGTHVSNGGEKQPNAGFNMFGPLVQLKYNFIKTIPAPAPVTIPEYNPNKEWFIFASVGSKNILYSYFDEDDKKQHDSRDYVAVAISSSYMYQWAHTSKAGIGLDITYDESANQRSDSAAVRGYELEADFIDKVSLGLYASYEQVIHKASGIIGLGYYIVRKEFPDEVPALYQKLGLKYHIGHNFFAGLNVRFFEFSKVDYLEWNIGYRITWL